MRILTATLFGVLITNSPAALAESTFTSSAKADGLTVSTENFSDILFFDEFNTDDCRPYDPNPRFTAPGGNWTEQENVQFQTFTVAASQRGGGIIEATLNSGRPDDIKPRLFACVDQACTGGSIVGHTNVDGNPARVRFQAAAGQSYVFRVEQFGNASPEQYPVTYSMTVDYGDRLDCWEPNNEIARSRLIRPGESVFAYMLEGYTDNSLTTGSYADWYRFTLQEAKFIEVDIRQPAGNHKMSVKVFDVPDDSGADVLMTNGSQPEIGQPFTAISTRERDPGVFYVRIGLALQDDSNVSGQDPEPPHWMNEYEMIVSGVDAP